MLTSHEFMVANKKRQENGNTKKKQKHQQNGNTDYPQQQYVEGNFGHTEDDHQPQAINSNFNFFHNGYRPLTLILTIELKLLRPL